MLSTSEVHQLERLVLSGLPTAAGGSSGLRRARQRGSGLEFHEYRPYHAGDDPRSIDWTVDARLQQLVVRVSRADANARLHVLVDVSASMGIGRPSKLAAATKLAAALCYVAVARHEKASVSMFDHAITRHVPATGGTPQLLQVFDMLGCAAASGRSALDRALRAYSGAVRGPGFVVILSDFFGSDSSLAGVQALMHRGMTPALVQIVALEELDPELLEATLLVDIEDAGLAPVLVDDTAVAAYRARMTEHSGSLRAFCRGRGLPWMRIASHATFTDLLFAAEQAGLFSEYA
jgi:uncharacterized protein (DUF58 family)